MMGKKFGKFLRICKSNELASTYAKEGDIMTLGTGTKLQVKKNRTTKCYYECYFNKLNRYNDKDEGQITYSCQALYSKNFLHSIINYLKYLRKPSQSCILPKGCHFERFKSKGEILEETTMKIKDMLRDFSNKDVNTIINKIKEVRHEKTEDN